VDPSIFPSSNQDSRTGSISNGMSRVLVAGKRDAEQGINGHWYSRALQADSPYYYQLTCGSATVSGSFTTANIALGNAYNEDVPLPPSLSSIGYYSPVGFYAWPQYVSYTDQSEQIIRPDNTLGHGAGNYAGRYAIAPSGPQFHPGHRYLRILDKSGQRPCR
jgi:hypothetical protein